MKSEVIIGSRESRLAVIQSEMVKAYIEENNPGLTVSLLTMKTTGDIILDRTLDKVGGKGLFVKELDKALTDGRSDLSVHSLKDMPMEVPESLPVVAYSKREDPRDVLVPFFPCTARIPCPAEGMISSGSKKRLILSSNPSLFRPAAARTRAEYSPPSSFASLVSTFPLTGLKLAPGYISLSWMTLRRLEQPIGSPPA